MSHSKHSGTSCSIIYRRFEVRMRAAFVDEGEHNRVVVNESDLLAAVDAGFEVTGRGLAPWADPHPVSAPLNEDYSRLTDPRKWRIIGARADAWSAVLVDAGLAVVSTWKPRFDGG